MTPDVTAVVVSHRSSPEAAECVASLRSAYRSEGIAGEIVLVDCGSGAEEVRRLDGAGADVLLPLPDNRGFAGGVNAGLARARSARILLSNADVVFRDGSISPLVDAIADPRAGAAAPLAFWDAGERLRLPPGWAPSLRRDLAQLSAGRSPARDSERFAAFARTAVRLWEEGGDVPHLSGAVLAARRDVFDRVGRFDERFPLEYEETEWEGRVRAIGLALRYVPRSRVRHLWGVSAAASPGSAARRAISRSRYRELHYDRLGRSLLERAERRARERRASDSLPKLALPRIGGPDGAWVAVSTNPSLLPFAGGPMRGAFEVPGEIVSRLPRGPVYLRTFSPSDGRPIETAVWERP